MKLPAVRRKTNRRLGRLLDLLAERYGVPRYLPRFEPMEELVSCVLSQHTSDTNSFPAFVRLRSAYPDWEAMIEAGPERIEPLIRSAGLSNQKSKALVQCLRKIRQEMGEISLDHLAERTLEEGLSWLLSLPSVGPKTASIVLAFAFGKPAIPVDTHVRRVAIRLGLLTEGCTEKAAHEELLAMVPASDAFRFHVLFIQHGRLTCRARQPACGECVVGASCPSHPARKREGNRDSCGV